MEDLEGQVFEFPFDRVHAQPMRQRGEDVEGLAGLLRARRGRDESPGACIVQAVRELDDEDADVLGHRHDHLAHGLGLRGLPVGEFVELRHTVDHGCDLGPEFRGELVERIRGVFDRVVQQCGGERDRQHPDLREDRRDCDGMGDIGVTGLPGLPAVSLLGDLVGPDDEVDVRLRMVRLQGPDHRAEHSRVARVVLRPGRPPG